jgi:nitroimidazol reductase NimA-like FMN-containing flavoprotein (pyridoxamine 5'-phosphate oxidase superfamily)
MEFESVCGNGVMEVLEDSQKHAALSALMDQYAPRDTHEFDEKLLSRTAVMKLTVHEFTGKRHL